MLQNYLLSGEWGLVFENKRAERRNGRTAEGWKAQVFSIMVPEPVEGDIAKNSLRRLFAREEGGGIQRFYYPSASSGAGK
jgi:hypothetical protein